MKNWKIISKIATYFTVTSALIAVFLAIITYLTLQITYTSPPIEYVIFVIFSTIMPYLLVTILSAIVAVMSRGAENPKEPQEESSETLEDEALPPAAEPAEDNA